MELRRLKVALLILVFALPLAADNRPPIDTVDPETQQYWSCVECSRDDDSVDCGGEPTAAGWINCKGGTIQLCDGYAGCIEVPNCGYRCAIA